MESTPFWEPDCRRCCCRYHGNYGKKDQGIFPPLITGTVVFTIGLSLYPTAINYMAGGTSNPDYGSWQNWLVAFFTLAVVTVLNHFGKGIWKLSSILIGMLAGYVVSIPFGMVDLSSVGKASVFQVPQPLHFGVHFEISACVAIGLLFAINSIQAIGDYSATTIGAMNRTPKDSELQGGIVAYGITNILGACSEDFQLQHTARTLVLLPRPRLSTAGFWDWQLRFLELPDLCRNFQHF